MILLITSVGIDQKCYIINGGGIDIFISIVCMVYWMATASLVLWAQPRGKDVFRVCIFRCCGLLDIFACWIYWHGIWTGNALALGRHRVDILPSLGSLKRCSCLQRRGLLYFGGFQFSRIIVARGKLMRTHVVAVGEVWVSSLPEGQEFHDGSAAPLRQAALVP